MKLIKIATDFENQFSEQQRSKTEEKKKFVCVEISTKMIVYMQFYDKVVLSLFFVSIPIDITRPRTAHISDCSRMTLNYELY